MATAILAPASAVSASAQCLAFRVGADENSMWPAVCPGDTIVVDPSLQSRRNPDVQAIYVLRFNGRGFVRRCSKVGDRLLILSDQEPSAGPPLTWVSLENRKILDIVRGRIVWIGRSLA
jgi:phage repressor protein C with HTH and peptisase S24 domain